MNRFLSLFTLLLALPLGAQITPERLKADPSLATDVYHVYEFKDSKLTRPPRGYKPVYISHMGRHGERYINRESYLRPGLAILENRALTPLGEKALGEVSSMVERTEGNWGALSSRGAASHRAIANRLFHRFSKVFRRGRTVRCASTEVPRCIISMANAANALEAARPGMAIDFRISEDIHCYLREQSLREHLYSLRDSVFALHPGAFDYVKACFTEPDGLSRKELTEVAEAIYYTWKNLPCLDLEAFDIGEYLSEELMMLYARHYSAWDYCLLSRSQWWQRELLNPLLGDFICRADEALERGDIAADLRFGHDTQLIPLYTALGLTANGQVMTYDEAPDAWDVASICPMASNIQMIFYKNRKGSVLVKVLKDECEVTIPALTPVKGPYYRWEDLADLLKNGK